MKKLFILLCVCCFFFSCSSERKKQVPTVFLTEPQMVDVMTDVQLIEAMIGYQKNVNKKDNYLKNVGYDSLFAHYGINDSIFKLNLIYYYDVEPLTLVRIMDSVESRLAGMKN